MIYRISMNNLFKKIFVLNLKERTDRWDQIYNHLHEIGLDEFERVEGTRLFFESTISQRLLSRISVTHSHLKIFRKITSDYTLVLEDDCQFFNNMEEILFKKSTQEFIHSNEWEMLLLGANKRIYRDHDSKVYHTKVKQVSEHVFEMEECGTAHAVLYKKSYIDKVLSLFPNDEEYFKKAFTMEEHWYVWDYFMSYFPQHYNTKIHCIYPLIAGQRRSFSNVQNEFVNYNKQLQNSWIEKYPFELSDY